MRRQRPRTSKTAQRRTRRGVAMIEVALVLPVFLMVVLGIIEFGQMTLVSHLLTNATRDAARSASLPGSTNDDVAGSIQQFLSETANVDAEEVTVTITIQAAPGNEDPENELEDAHRRDRVSVSAQVTFSEISWMKPFFLSDATKLSGRCVMRRE